MFKIENICEKISNNIAQELNLDDDKKSVINYGIFAFIQMMNLHSTSYNIWNYF